MSASGKRRDRSNPWTRQRYDVDRLLALIPETDSYRLAERAGVSRRCVRSGSSCTWYTADKLAVAAGHLPYDVWPEWLDVAA